MNTQPDFEALRDFSDKMNEVEKALNEFLKTGRQLAGIMSNHGLKSKRFTSAVRTRQPVEEITGDLYETFKQCPGVFSSLSTQAERLSVLTGEVNSIIFDKFLKQ